MGVDGLWMVLYSPERKEGRKQRRRKMNYRVLSEKMSVRLIVLMQDGYNLCIIQNQIIQHENKTFFTLV